MEAVKEVKKEIDMVELTLTISKEFYNSLLVAKERGEQVMPERKNFTLSRFIEVSYLEMAAAVIEQEMELDQLKRGNPEGMMYG